MEIKRIEILLYSFMISVMFVAGLSGHSNKHFVFISASYNNAQWYKRSLRSVFSQKYTNWSMIYINDFSDDETGKLVESYVAKRNMKSKVKIINNAERMGHCYNQYHAIHSCPDNVVIVILDGDDWLAHNGVLTLLNKVYQDDVWITYGQFRYFNRGTLGCSRQIPQKILEENAIRDLPGWITSHMRTFYAGLYKKIDKEDLMHGGKFLPKAVDVASMIPMIEMAGWHSRFINEVVYIYNDSTALNFFKQGAEQQRQILNLIRSYPRYNRLETPPFQARRQSRKRHVSIGAC